MLFSSSKGNCAYIKYGRDEILIDCGVSARSIEHSLKSLGTGLSNINAVFITHEHSDHIKGLGVVARKYNVPIYANAKTWQAMDGLVGNIPTDLRFQFDMETTKTFGSIDICSFAVSHDAADPMFYTFHEDGRKLVVITDTGYVSDRMKGHIAAADSYVFESNHDVGMLQMGRYPWSVKRRILSDVGHVSNEDAAVAMSEVVAEKQTQIYLSHLSKDNNMKDLARLSVQQTLQSCGIITGEYVHLHDTNAEKATPLVIV